MSSESDVLTFPTSVSFQNSQQMPALPTPKSSPSTICRCKRHSQICYLLQHMGRPRSETCQGCHGFFSWSHDATPYLVAPRTATQDSAFGGEKLCRCKTHTPECITFFIAFDAGKCTCCHGWLPFSDRAMPFIKSGSGPRPRTVDSSCVVDDADLSGMMNWEGTGNSGQFLET
jgi:hypothetical protein